MFNKSVRRSISMTFEIAGRLKQIASTKPRNVTETNLSREALRLYLDHQEDLIGSRRHFQKGFRSRIDQLEEALAFHMTVLLLLLSTTEEDLIREAIIAARKCGDRLLAQMEVGDT